jgi:predicted RNase H-like nuclease (RuvC/YqgF family)
MDLKTILGESYTDDIAKKLTGYDVFEKGKAMPMEKYNSKLEEANAQKKELKDQVDNLNSTLTSSTKDFEKFKKAAEGNADLQKQLQDYQDKFNTTQNEFNTTLKTKESEWSQREANNRKAYTLREKMLVEHADPKYIDMLMKQVDLNKITEADGKFIGVDDVVKGVKTDYEKLFGQSKIVGGGINAGIQTTIPENVKAAQEKAKSGLPEDRLAYMKAKQDMDTQNKE